MSAESQKYQTTEDMNHPPPVWLVTYNRKLDLYESSSLEDWIRIDLDLWCKRTFDSPDLDWLILSAHSSEQEAVTEIERLQESEA